ncbi:MAG: DUF4469 domain-containing protein [Prevotellaceae bacterium]|jgi:hypothetical protein|nr:DUF4469 domain-containing protein [Prevotellaceae bacterium]
MSKTVKRFFWKIWLRINFLTKNVDNDYIAEISTTGNTLHNEDIARQIVAERSELRYETILSILNERDTVVRNAVLSGSSAQDGNIRIAPRITGTWIGSSPLFDPAVHKITVDVIPTAEFRKSLEEEVGVEILGTKTDGGAHIGLVTDVLTGKNDGVVSPSGDIIITGEKLKIVPADDPATGVFFVDANNIETSLDYPVTENNPKKIICRVPANLPNGLYTLKIVTCFSTNSVLLKTPRSIVYDLPLKIGIPDTQS